jgi:hypothetical protein
MNGCYFCIGGAAYYRKESMLLTRSEYKWCSQLFTAKDKLEAEMDTTVVLVRVHCCTELILSARFVWPC